MGRVLVEAISCDLPVVTSKVGGIPDVVIDGKTGLLVEAGNSGFLVRAILDLLKNPERARMMGEEGRKISLSDFSSNKMVRQIDELYQVLLSQVVDKVESSK